MANKVAKLTRIVLIVVIAGLVIYDVFALTEGGTEATISWQVASYVYDVPAIAFAVGFICGHLFWQMKPKKSGLDEH